MVETLESVTRQTIPPALWVIVDDGSTDRTPEILAEWRKKFDYIQVLTLPNKGDRKVGPGVINAFYAGLDLVKLSDYEYVCKLDLDLKLPHEYFEKLIERMLSDHRLGTCSGKPYMILDGEEVSEKCGDENSVGMTKFYRVACFQAIGGFVRQVMWDGIDGHRCRMLGWKAESYDESDIRFIHLRPMGSSYKGIVTGRVRHGYGQYFMGTSFIYMFVSSVYRMSRPPVIIGGLAMFYGYLKSAIFGENRYDDRDFRRFLRRYQWRCLIHGKTNATIQTNVQQASVWEANQSTCLASE